MLIGYVPNNLSIDYESTLNEDIKGDPTYTAGRTGFFHCPSEILPRTLLFLLTNIYIEKAREASSLYTKEKQKVKSKNYSKPAIPEALELGIFEVWHVVFQRIIQSTFNM